MKLKSVHYEVDYITWSIASNEIDNKIDRVTPTDYFRIPKLSNLRIFAADNRRLENDSQN